eukprot:TRINITY_DN390_c0_g6_i1.p1 TRINITY_DN390_c0_g6~~TRINITY_DN390_c0_g6_i1.p1  ORF type:complete len:320 (+),score=68.68 TRINITY_DN390_c0_g6_i1:48-962(+)
MSGVSAGILGGLAAMTASTLTHPVDSLKVRMFLHGEGKSNSAAGMGIVKTIYKNEGIKQGFYRGVTATWLRQALFSTSRFGVNDLLQGMMGKGKGKADINVFKKMVSSAMAGATAACFSCPADLVLVRMQADGKLPVEQRRGYRNVFHGIRSIIKDEGATQLYRGLRPLVVRGCLVTAGQFTTYDVAKKALITRAGFSDGTKTHLLASTMAGTVSTLIVNPLDVVKSRMMQSQSIPKNSAKITPTLMSYTSDLDCVIKTYKYEGVRGFYKGLIPCFMRQCPQVIFMWVIFEQYKSLYDRLTTTA